MENNGSTNTRSPTQGTGGTTRLAYEAPELITYNQSEITRGGLNPKIVDFVGGGTTNYKS